jgi:hypothetical protein
MNLWWMPPRLLTLSKIVPSTVRHATVTLAHGADCFPLGSSASTDCAAGNNPSGVCDGFGNNATGACFGSGSGFD